MHILSTIGRTKSQMMLVLANMVNRNL